jgi:hypothetical protein
MPFSLQLATVARPTAVDIGRSALFAIGDYYSKDY